MVLTYDPEFQEALTGHDGPVPVEFKTVTQLKEFTDASLNQQFRIVPTAESITQTKIPFYSRDGTRLHLTRFASEEMIQQSSAQPAVLYVHGGGGTCGSVEIYAPLIAYLADYIGFPVFGVEYRLATDEPPTSSAAHDVFSGLEHLSQNAEHWNIDPSRIVIMGDSAGGGIAAGTTLLARDRSFSPPIAKQVLIYPMLDDRSNVHDNASWEKLLLWSGKENELCWKAILGKDKAGKVDADVSVYAAPGRAMDLKDMPPTYIEVGGLDLFVHESVAFAAKLLSADVEVELHVWPGLPHGFEAARQISFVGKAFEARKRALHQVKRQTS